MLESKSCPICLKSFKGLAKHVADMHLTEYATQEQRIVDLYRAGASAEEIGHNPNVIHTNKTSIMRILRRYIDDAEIEATRRARIAATLAKNHATGILNCDALMAGRRKKLVNYKTISQNKDIIRNLND